MKGIKAVQIKRPLDHQTSKSRNQTSQKTTELEICVTFPENESMTQGKPKMEPDSMKINSWVGEGQSPNQEISSVFLGGCKDFQIAKNPLYLLFSPFLLGISMMVILCLAHLCMLSMQKQITYLFSSQVYK